ncbi:MAG: alpha/beta hydrolase [Sedimentisphaerales bacterium]|nr:alpha/beta hydrolase [Sedimentisphaerales bacterium]
MIATRTYGETGPYVILIHGGPAAPGGFEPVIEKLSPHFCILEPYQRSNCCDQPLTVAQHIADLHEVILHYCPNDPPALVGHSWGAMLALAYASAHPDSVASLALIGCGTFDIESRKKLNRTREERLGKTFDQAFQELSRQYPDDPDQAIAALGRVIKSIDAYQLIQHTDQFPAIKCDAQAHRQTWQDMLRLQQQSIYPQTFSNITCPAIMIHGDHDPHPGEMIYANLKKHIPQLELILLARCGHYPWLEQHAHQQFHTQLQNWLNTHH